MRRGRRACGGAGASRAPSLLRRASGLARLPKLVPCPLHLRGDLHLFADRTTDVGLELACGGGGPSFHFVSSPQVFCHATNFIEILSCLVCGNARLIRAGARRFCGVAQILAKGAAMLCFRPPRFCNFAPSLGFAPFLLGGLHPRPSLSAPAALRPICTATARAHARREKWSEPPCKPGSVPPARCLPGGGEHSSRAGVAAGLQRATRERGGPPHCSPMCPCSGWGLPCRPCRHGRGALLPHRFTLAGSRRRSVLCGAVPRVTSAGRWPAPCPLEPGLSSRAV